MSSCLKAQDVTAQNIFIYSIIGKTVEVDQIQETAKMKVSGMYDFLSQGC